MDSKWPLLLCLFGYSGIAKAKDAYTLNYQFGKKGKEYINLFTLRWASPDSNLQTIDVFAPGSTTPVQTIQIPQERVKILWKDLQGTNPDEVREQIVDQFDFNFDRHMDLRILREFPSSTGIKSYLVFLYDSTKSKYVLNEEISALPSPVPVSKTKVIETTTVGGYGGFESSRKFFSVTPFGKLTLEMEMTQKVVDAKRMMIEKEASIRTESGMKVVCKTVEEPEAKGRILLGTAADCKQYLGPVRPKKRSL